MSVHAIPQHNFYFWITCCVINQHFVKVVWIFTLIIIIIQSFTTHIFSLLLSNSDDMAPHAVTKYIVHEDKLMELFKRCPVCTRSCEITKNVIGTLLQVKQSCSHCDYVHQWSSQPMVNNIPAGNLQLCAAVLFTGSSFVQISKVRQEQICNDRYFYITWLQVFHHIMLFFSCSSWMLSRSRASQKQLSTNISQNSFSLPSTGSGNRTRNT